MHEVYNQTFVSVGEDFYEALSHHALKEIGHTHPKKVLIPVDGAGQRVKKNSKLA